MDTLVFIVALAVVAAVIGWYFVNETKREDGSAGLLALRSASEGAPPDAADGEDTSRYRVRTRLTPARRAGLQPAAPSAKTYRSKPAERLAYRKDDISGVDKEY